MIHTTKPTIKAIIYNKDDFNIDNHQDDSFIEAFIKTLTLENLEEIDRLDGQYALSFDIDSDHTILVRDKIGIMPLFYRIDKNTIKTAINKKDLPDAIELNPRQIGIFDKKAAKIRFLDRTFYQIAPKIKKDKKSIVKELSSIFIKAIIKRVPKDGSKIGILFSGGVDSTLLAYTLKMLKTKGKIKNDLICYTAAFSSEGLDKAKDLISAKKVAQYYGFQLKISELKIDESEKIIKETMDIIQSKNVVKIGVGATGLAAGKLALKDNIKVIFTGLGSEELFAGYERHKNSEDINKECLKGLLMVHKRDCYRDFTICNTSGLQLRLPFLDDDLIRYSLRIPAKFKIDKEQNKVIIREVAKYLGILPEFANRKKLGAQYGSRLDKAISKIAKNKGFKYKSEYLDSLWNEIC